MTPEHRELYRKRIDQMPKVLERQNKRGVSPDKVAAAIEKALTSSRPRPRYLVGDAYVLLGLKRLLPTRWFDRLLYRLTS